MAKNFIENGEAIKITAKSTVKSGDLIVLGDLAVVALTDIAKGEVGAASAVGVWELKAQSADVISQGATVYWNDSAKEVTITAGSNTAIGKAWSESPATSTLVAVKLNA